MSKLVSSLVFWALVPGVAFAQITPDSSLGEEEKSVVNTNGNRDTINGGAIRNANLFHSFQEFNVEAGREAYFTNPDGIANIFSRVTGNNLSNIQGVLGVLGNANLYLINPNGILFGENARLDVNGSFFATTADSVLFGNGFEFSAANPNAPPLLTIDIPIGLRFRDNPGDITVRGNGNGARLLESEVIDTQEALRVDSDFTIGLIGGNLLFEDATIKTAGGRIELGSVAEGELDLIEVANGFTVDYSGIENFRDISLAGRSVADASGLGGGEIQVAGSNISLTGVSGFLSNTLGSKPGGDINILATESLEISGVENELNFVSGIVNRIFPNGTAEAGDINIETGSLRLDDRAFIGTFVSGQGNAGDININASNSVSLESQGSLSGIASSVAEGAIGNGGDINITTTSLSLSNRAFLRSDTSGKGNAGNIIVNSNNFITLKNNSNINADSFFAEGDAGNITLNTNSLTLDNGGALSVASLSSEGNAGNITLNTNSLTLNNGVAFSVVSLLSEGNAGNITINATGSLTINNRANFFAFDFLSQSKGGNVTINTTDNVSFANNSNIFVSGTEGGSINISAKNLSLISDSGFFSGINIDSGFTDAQSGDIVINLTEDLVMDGLDGERITSINNSNFGTGNAGNIDIKARNITLRNGGQINSDSNGKGKIGNINLTATGNIVLDGLRILPTGLSNSISEGATGDIGEINITAQNLTLTNGASLQSLVSGTANSGDINLNITDRILVDGFSEFVLEDGTKTVLLSIISSEVSNTGVGDSGAINIKTNKLDIFNDGQIRSTISGRGNGGIINIDAVENISLDDTNDFPLATIISTRVQEGGMGNAGQIILNTRNLTVANGAGIDSSTFGTGNAGSVTINATDAVSLDGEGRNDLNSSISSSVEMGAVGSGGEVEVNATNLFLTNGAQILSATFGNGNAGSVTINVADTVSLDGEDKDGFPSAITSGVELGAVGDGGKVLIDTKHLLLTNGAGVNSITGSNGNAGFLTIRASESIELSGASAFGGSSLSTGAVQGNGNGNNLNIFTDDLIIRDGAIISVGNFSSSGLFSPGTGEAGNVKIEANSISLENGQINAATQAGDEGNITLKVSKDIILRDNSLISARALKDATGGNIDINARFIVAFPNQNNDIIASAELGTGGNIDLTAEAIFGIEERSSTPPNQTNDIDASSEFGLDGSISIETPTVDPTSGLLELTEEVVDPSKLIAQNVCTQTANSEFVDIGKGGLPQNPEGMLAEDTIEVGLVAPIISSSEATESTTEREEVKPRTTRKPPAQGWIWHENGTVELVAYNPNQVGEQRTWDNHRGCQN